MNYKHTIAVIAVFCLALLIPVLVNAATDTDPQASDPEEDGLAPCCGENVDAWYFERRIDDQVIDSGVLKVRKKGMTAAVFPSSEEGLLKLVTIMLPVPAGEFDAGFTDGKKYFTGRVFGLGTIYAEEITPGEVWLFQHDDDIIVDDEGYIFGSSFALKATVEIGNDWEKTWDVEGPNGVWCLVTCTGNDADFLYRPAGCQWEELWAQELRDHVWVEITLPEGLGRFYGRAYTVGTVWAVTIEGEEFTAVATVKDENAIVPQAEIIQ